MTRTKTTEGLRAILPRLVQTMKGRKKFQMHMIFYHWEKIAGSQIAMHVRPVRMDFRTLFLYADAPAWAAQLRYMERELIDKINAYATSELVTSIRYTNYLENKKHKKNIFYNHEKEWISAVPDEEDKKRAKEFCSGIEDAEVRAAAERAFSKKTALDREQEKRKYHACVVCGVLCPPNNDVCTVCDRKRREEKCTVVRRAIAKEPWLSYGELYERFQCTPEMAMEQRLELIRLFARQVDVGDEKSEDAKKIVMLWASLHPEELTPEITHKVLSKMCYDLNFKEDGFKKKSEKHERKRYVNRRYERGKRE